MAQAMQRDRTLAPRVSDPQLYSSELLRHYDRERRSSSAHSSSREASFPEALPGAPNRTTNNGSVCLTSCISGCELTTFFGSLLKRAPISTHMKKAADSITYNNTKIIHPSCEPQLSDRVSKMPTRLIRDMH